jgi:hypothetical protein
MTTGIRAKIPAGWIVLPALSGSAISTLAAWATGSLPLAALVMLATGLLAAWWTERCLRSLIEPIAQIAGGDRYAALPKRIGGC